MDYLAGGLASRGAWSAGRSGNQGSLVNMEGDWARGGQNSWEAGQGAWQEVRLASKVRPAGGL